MSTPETKAKKRTKDVLAEVCAARGLHYRIDWHAGTSFAITLDGTGTVAGHPVAIELKRFDGKGKLTARQRMNLQEFRDAGASVFVIECEKSLQIFRRWLETLEPRWPYYG